MRRSLIVLAALTLVVTTACGPASSTAESTTTSSEVTATRPAITTTGLVTTSSEAEQMWPPRLAYPSLVYDQRSNSVVLFGGDVGVGFTGTPSSSNDTWIFDVGDRTWSRAKPSMRPPSRSLGALAHDTQSGLVVMIGGNPPPTPLLNTWIYNVDNQDWRLGARGPVSKEREQRDRVENGLICPSIAYDTESDRTVLFGGEIDVPDAFFLDETWVYDADTDTWENMQPDLRPIGRTCHGLTYDPESDRVLAWGGITPATEWDRSPTALFDLNVWAYDYNTNTWTEHINENGPRPTGYDGPITFDTESDRMVVIRENAEVWVYDYNSNTWTQQPPQSTEPINTAFSGITYIGGEIDRIALYGGCLKLVLTPIELTDFVAHCSNELWFYDLNTNPWEKIGPPGG